MSATVSHRQPGAWLAALLHRRPHQIVGPADDQYLLRWLILPRNRFLNIYLQYKFTASDDPQVLHDHQWWFASVVRSVHTPTGARVRRRVSVAVRPAVFRHRIELPASTRGRPRVCRTLVVTGPKVRRWGFWCAKPGLVAWQQFNGGCTEEQP